MSPFIPQSSSTSILAFPSSSTSIEASSSLSTDISSVIKPDQKPKPVTFKNSNITKKAVLAMEAKYEQSKMKKEDHNVISNFYRFLVKEGGTRHHRSQKKSKKINNDRNNLIKIKNKNNKDTKSNDKSNTNKNKKKNKKIMIKNSRKRRISKWLYSSNNNNNKNYENDLKKKSKMKFNQKDDNNTENEDQLNSFYINEESDINNDKDYINEDESIEQLNFQSELNNSYSSLTELSKLKGKSKKESEEEEEESYLSSFFSHHSSSFYIHENELSFSDSVYSSSLNSINLDSSLNSNSDLNSRRRRKSSSTGTNNNQDNLLIQNQSEDFIIRDESFSSISTINSQSSHHSSLYSYDDNNIRINVNDDNKPDFTQRLQKENVEYNDDSHKSNLPRTISLTRLKEYHDIHHHIDQEKILSHKGSYKLNLNLNINRNQPSISTIPSHHSTVSISSNKKKVIHKSSLASSIFSVHSHSKSNSISSNSTNNEHKGIINIFIFI